MALLANTCASGRLEFRWIDNRAWEGIRKVLLRRAVTAFAGDGFFRKDRGSILVQGPRDMQRSAGMAKHTLFRNRPSEIRILLVLETWSQIIRMPALVVRNR